MCARAVCYIKGCAQRRRTLCAQAEERGKGRRRRRRRCEVKKNKARENEILHSTLTLQFGSPSFMRAFNSKLRSSALSAGTLPFSAAFHTSFIDMAKEW